VTRNQRLAALAAGAILLVGFPVAGAHQAPPPDLGEPVVVGRTGPAPEDTAVPPRSDSRATEHPPTRSPSPGATTQPSDPDEDVVAPGPAAAGTDDTDTDDTAPTAAAQPVTSRSSVPAGAVSDDDQAPTGSPRVSATSATPGPTGDDDGADGDD
jgi:hypothetical protein